jgi:hypothetical protein
LDGLDAQRGVLLSRCLGPGTWDLRPET